MAVFEGRPAARTKLVALAAACVVLLVLVHVYWKQMPPPLPPPQKHYTEDVPLQLTELRASADVGGDFCAEFEVPANRERLTSCSAALMNKWTTLFRAKTHNARSEADWQAFYAEKAYFCLLPFHPTSYPRVVEYSGIQTENLVFWRDPESKERESLEHRMKYFSRFYERIKAGLKEARGIDFSFDQYAGKVVANVAGGPFGGMIEAFDVPAAKRVQIDLFMDQLAALKYRPWKKTCFVTAPAEHINLPDNSVDLLIGLNSLDHGWRVDHCLYEIVRVAKEAYVSFDVRGDVFPPFHMQVITWDMVDKVVAKISARTDVEYAFVKPFSDGKPKAEFYMRKKEK